jgi:ATP-dependent helicase/nuclease subunit B
MRPADLFSLPRARRAPGRIFTVPHGRPFLRTIAEALLAGQLPSPRGRRFDPLELSGITLLLPTRRDIAAVQEAFLEAANGAALLLPKIKLISHLSDAPAPLPGEAGQHRSGAGKPQIGKLERELALARLVLQWSRAIGASHGGEPTRTPAQAIRQAKELARLMDMAEMEDASLAGLEELVPDDLSTHWELTLDFLKIVTEHWPPHLEELGKVSPAAWRKGLMLMEAERLSRSPPAEPTIVAGVTGTVPAATLLMRAVLAHELGALVLPALDLTLDAESWNAIVPAHPEHPQFGLKKLLDALGVARSDVALLPGPPPTPRQRARARFLSEAMRPASTTERWHAFLAGREAPKLADALRGCAILEAPSAAEEAEAIALILREAAEHPGKTAGLVTPDRALAHRVSVRLKAWALDVPDLSGRPLAGTEVGVFLELLLEAAAQHFSPVALLSLLKHPLVRAGLEEAVRETGIRTLELAAFRAPYLGRGLADIGAALERAALGTLRGQHRGRAVRRIGPERWQAARELLRRLAEILAPLERLFAAAAPTPLARLAEAHVRAAEALSAKAATGGDTLWQGDGGEEFARLFASLLDRDLIHAPELAAADYPEFYRGLLSDQTLPAPGPRHPRLSICGPLEARLQQPDIVILGSLNEGTWPQAADPGPWFNRSMRHALGLPAPEERIGEAAHDFASLLGAETVYLTRAGKKDGAPTVPSRWLIRLAVLARGAGLALEAHERWLAWADLRNRSPGPARPTSAPEPRPALHLRPRQLSVTDIEKWIANPYAIFAARILQLERLPDLSRLPDAALRGEIVHEALSRFAHRFPDALPADCADALGAAAEAALVELTGSPRVAAFWAPRLQRFAAWFGETEPARRRTIAKSLAERDGALVLPAPGGPFTLKARADRIDVGAGALSITDYKTSASLDTLVRNARGGRAPQLALEAAIAAGGGFPGVPARPVGVLRYISAAGGKPPGLEAEVACNPGEVAHLAEGARAGLALLIAEFDRAETPYRAVRRPRFRYDFDEFAHLARVAEWSIESEEEGP